MYPKLQSLKPGSSYQDTVPSFRIDHSREDDVLDGVEDDAAVRLGRGLTIQAGAWRTMVNRALGHSR